MITKVIKTNKNLLSRTENTNFMDKTFKYKQLDNNKEVYSGNSNGIFRESPNKCRIIELIRLSSVTRDIAKPFIELIYLTSLLEITADKQVLDTNVVKVYENICLIKLQESKLMFDAREELSRVVSSDVDTITPGFRMIYQMTTEDNLNRLDILFSENQSDMDREKLELGLRLMKKGNQLRQQHKGQNKTF